MVGKASGERTAPAGVHGSSCSAPCKRCGRRAGARHSLLTGGGCGTALLPADALACKNVTMDALAARNQGVRQNAHAHSHWLPCPPPLLPHAPQVCADDRAALAYLRITDLQPLLAHRAWSKWPRPALCARGTATAVGQPVQQPRPPPEPFTRRPRHSLAAWLWLLGWRLAVGPAPLLCPAAGAAAAAAPGRPGACRPTARRPNDATHACRGGSSSMPRRAYPTDGVMK